jgi:two-component system response regulator FixJ
MTLPKDNKRKPLIYIVDDDDGMRRALTVLITTIGYQPLAFAKPTEFLAKYDPNQPGCLVLDVRMPLVSGFELQSATSGTSHDLPIVFITGHGGEDVRAQAVSAGAVDLLFKPIDEDRLMGAIDTALARSADRQQARS